MFDQVSMVEKTCQGLNYMDADERMRDTGSLLHTPLAPTPLTQKHWLDHTSHSTKHETFM